MTRGRPRIPNKKTPAENMKLFAQRRLASGHRKLAVWLTPEAATALADIEDANPHMTRSAVVSEVLLATRAGDGLP